MPKYSTKAKKVLRALSLITVHCALITILSGCKVIGTTKPAALQVATKPEAAVFLDGKHVGKTPFYSDQLKPGEYMLKITAAEASYVNKITLSENGLTVVNRELNSNFLAQAGETLWLDKGKKGVFIASMPAEADITIDGKLLAKTPSLLEDIEDGEHKVTIAKAGYISREFAVKSSNKYLINVSVTLASEIAKNGPAPSPVTQIQKVEVLKTTQGFVRVRIEPTNTATEVGRVTTGDQLEVIQETKDFVKVSFEGKSGWVPAQFTKKI